jgi:hypothetical protein
MAWDSPLPEEEKVVSAIVETLRGMSEYLKPVLPEGANTHQRLVIQASRHGWYVTFHSDDHFTACDMSGLSDSLLEALQSQEEIPNPLYPPTE